MAKYNITHRCGHVVACNISGSNSQGQRDWQVQNKESQICQECWKVEQATKAASLSNALPTLIGTDKQIAWAMTLRLQKYSELDAFFVDCHARCASGTAAGLYSASSLEAKVERIKKAVAIVKSNSDAKFWIDNRGTSVDSIIMTAILRKEFQL